MSLPWITRSKLAAPTRPADWLPRPGLLGAAGDRPVVALVAGPGHGKTLGMLAMLEPDGLLLWYTLDATDADPVSFFAHLLAGMRLHVPDFARELDAMLTGGQPAPAKLWAGFWNALEAYNLPGLTLALDDLHHLAEAEPEWVRALGTHLGRLPPHTRVLLSARRPLPLPVARLKAAGQLALLGAGQLRFTPGEELAYLRARAGGDPPVAWLARASQLDGWPLGLRLASGTGPDALEPDADDLTAYVAEDLFEPQPAACRTFMVQAALLDSLEPETLEAVFPGCEAARWLETLEGEQLVQGLAGGGHRFPAYLGEFLRGEGARTVARPLLASWHARIAAHHQGAGRPDLAVGHFLAIGDLEGAYRAAGEAYPALSAAGRFEPIERWLAAFPPAFEQDHPHLSLWRGHLRARQGDNDLALEDYERARRGFEALDDRRHALKAIVRQCAILAMGQESKRLRPLMLQAQAQLAEAEDVDQADFLMVRGLLADQRGDAALMRECNEAILTLQDPGPEVASARWIAHVNLFTWTFHHGDLDLARRHVAAAIAVAERAHFGAYALFARFLAAHLDLVVGDVEAAAAFIRALPAGWRDQLEWQDLGVALTIVGHAHQARGEWREAEDALARAVAVFTRADHKLGLKVPLERQAWLAIQRGQPARALAICAEASAEGDNYYDLALGVAHARALHLAGEHTAARDRWDALLTALADQDARLLLAQASLYAAATYLALGEAERAAGAREACQRHGYEFLLHQDRALWNELEAAPQELPAPAAGLLEIRCYGGFEARVDGVLAEHWPRRKAKRVLAALALNPRGLEAPALAELLEEQGPHAPAAVRKAIMALRRVLEPALEKGEASRFVIGSGDGYRLADEALGLVDVRLFEAAAREASQLAPKEPAGAAEAASRALALYRGNLLDESLFEGAFEPERQAHQRQALQLLALIYENAMRQGNPAAAEVALRRAVELAPCEEEPYLELIRFQVAHGQAERARQTYWDHRKALKARLGVAPSEEFEAAYRAAVGAKA